MPKKNKTSSQDLSGGTQIDGNIDISGNGTFIGRDQNITEHSGKLKFEIIIPIVVALIALVGVIVTAIVNYTTEIDKIKISSQMTQTAEAMQIVPTATLLAPTSTPYPITLIPSISPMP